MCFLYFFSPFHLLTYIYIYKSLNEAAESNLINALIQSLPLSVNLKCVNDRNVVNNDRIYLLHGVIFFYIIDYLYMYT